MARRALKTVYSRPRAFVISGTTFAVLFSLFSLVPSAHFILRYIASGAVSSQQKLSFIVSSYGSLFSTQGTVSAILAIVLMGVASMQVAVLYEYYNRSAVPKKVGKRVYVSNVSGLVAGILGLGCAACGSVIFSVLALNLGVSGLLLLLPFGGLEISLIGIFLMSYSLHYLLGKFEEPPVCR